jgi:phosphatidylinositol alpha-1,6-mannosyltransferase
LRQRAIHIAAQSLAPGNGGIARCARLTLLSLARRTRVIGAFAVADSTSTRLAGIETRPFSDKRLNFVAANAFNAFNAGVVLYDFPGTARAHAPLRFCRTPYALWVHGWEVWSENLRQDYAKAIRRAQAVFVNSMNTQHRLEESLPGLNNIHVCWLGTERDADSRSVAFSQGERERMVLFVGRSDELFAKGQEILIDVWPSVVARVPDAMLCFVGGGARLDRLRSLVANSPVSASIRVLGQLSEDEVAALYDRARAFAMLSTVEGFGLVYAEALSHGLPIITSTSDGAQEINLEGRTGFSIDRGDHVALTNRIVSFLQDDALFFRFSCEAYDHWLHHFSLSAFSGRFLAAAAKAGVI